MQTFLPLPDFAETARVLDRQRLGKQRVEALQILNALDARFDVGGWKNHPATKMWLGFPEALIDYAEAVCTEWVRRGYRDSVLPKLEEKRWHGRFVGNKGSKHGEGPRPPWLGYEAFHASHRSNLLRKLPEHYRQFWPDEPDDLPYVWPSSEVAT